MMDDRADSNTGAFWCPYCKIDTTGNHEAHCPHNYQKQRDTVMFYGAWECPRCRQVNAPWVSRCDCGAPTPGSSVGNIRIVLKNAGTAFCFVDVYAVPEDEE